MLVENYSNSRSLQTLSAAEAIFSGLRANVKASKKKREAVHGSEKKSELVYGPGAPC